MKYSIEKNSVQETLIIPLYGRKKCAEVFPQLFQDEIAVKLIEQIDYDFDSVEKKYQGYMHQFGLLEVAMRQHDVACEVRSYLDVHPRAAVVNLGCGLDATGRSCDNGSCLIYNIDFPDVIAVRDQLLPAGEREKNIGCDLKNPLWFNQIDDADGVVFFAAGVFYYFPQDEVQSLVLAMSKRFPGGKLVFDACGKMGVKMMLKTWIQDAGIRNVGAYFSVRDARKEIGSWSSHITVSSRGYMLGYHSLDDPTVKPLQRVLAKVGDNWIKMQIVRLDFC